MASLIDKKGTYKNPPWFKSQPFKKGKPGYGSQIMAIVLIAIIAMILYY
tara:strand:+ start:978 stop:1124 length:147 start_codon:yes stop_codon:yes gene_type:complete